MLRNEPLSSLTRSPALASNCDECHQKDVTMVGMDTAMGLDNDPLNDSE